MADFNITINLKAQDLNTSQVMAGIRGNLKGLNGELAGLGRGGRGGDMLGQLGSGLTQAGSAMNQLTQSARGVLDPIIKEGVTFERSMAEVLAFGGSQFAPFMDQLHDQARQLGRDTEFTAVQAAQSMRQLAQAGLSPAEIMGQLPTVMDLAKAGALDLAPAAKIVASTMAQFSVETSQAADVADILARTANSTQTNVREIGQALGFAGTSADLLGLNVEQTSVLLAGLGKTAITSGKAGRWLDAMFLGLSRLTNPDLRKGLRQIGVDQKELTKNLESQNIGGILKQFQEGFAKKGLSAPRQLEVLTKIFGKQGARAMAALMKQMEGGKFDELTKSIHDYSGAAKQMGDIMSDTTKGDIMRADSALSDLKLTIADELLPALRPLLEDVTQAAKDFSEWASKHPELVRELGVLAIKLVALGTVMGPLLTVAGSAVTLISLIGKVSKATATGGVASLTKEFPLLGKNLSTVVGSKAGMLGLLGGAAAAAALGYAFGTLVDDTFGISDALSGLNTEMSIHNELMAQGLSLQIGLSKVRGAALLGDMTDKEKKDLLAAQEAKTSLSAELMNAPSQVALSAAGLTAEQLGRRSKEDVSRDIQKQQAIIDKINEEANKRKADAESRAIAEAQSAVASTTRAQPDRTGELIDALNQNKFGPAGGATIVVKVDQQNRFIGVEGQDDTGVANGTMTEGL